MRNKNITKNWVASLLLGATGLLTSNLYASVSLPPSLPLMQRYMKDAMF
jgi:hypothetical protein